jgi:hypothetical protein
MAQIIPHLLDAKYHPARAAAIQADIEADYLSRAVGQPCRNFDRIATADLRLLFQLYDEQFFAGLIRRSLAANDIQLSFRLSPRLTSAGGKTIYDSRRPAPGKPRPVEIVISTTLLFESFTHPHSQHLVAGCECHSRLQALLRIFEHELLHLIEINDTGTSSCAAAPFRNLARRVFGHLKSNHQLLRPTDRARLQHGLGVGDRVRFLFEGNTYCGTVNRITRRATVLVPSAHGTLYNDGQRYTKFYIPIHQLHRAATEEPARSPPPTTSLNRPG